MKKQQGLRWKIFSGNKRDKDSLVEAMAAVGAAVLFDLICALIFLCSAADILRIFYDTVEYSEAFFVRAGYLFLIVGVLLEVAERRKKLPALLLRFGIVILGFFVAIRWAMQEAVAEKLVSGFWSIATQYLEAWNAYFITDWYCPDGIADNAGFFLETALLAAAVFFLWLAKVIQNNNGMALLPMILLAAELLIGISPSGRGIFLLFIGCLLASNRSFTVPDFRLSEEKKGKYNRKFLGFAWITTIVIACVLCITVFIAGRQSAEKVVEQYAGKAEDVILDTANRVANWKVWRMVDDPGGVEKMVESVLGTEDYNYETLDNRTPIYEDVPYLKVTMEEQPLNRVYLKGFYADIYDSGIWERNEENFIAQSEEAGFETEFVTEELAVLGVEKLKKRYNVNDLSIHTSGVETTVFYYDSSTAKAYVPYFSEVSREGISIDAEGNFKKRLSEEEASFTMWKYAGSFDTRLRNFSQGARKNWEDWYENYVLEQYLTVPDIMSNVKKVAEELATEDINRTQLGIVETENEKRLAKGFLVADWMGRNTTYSLELPKLPWREDPIEYFLGDSRMGYCMHYASAAVMILREMGVPARYASGYVVSPSSFELTTEGYVSEVLDNQAHAWAEIYLDGIGWVPMEVTAGYSTLLPTPTPTPVPTNTPTPTPTNTPTPTPTNTPTPVPTESIATLAPEETPLVTQGAALSPVPTAGAEHPITEPTMAAVATPTPTPTPTPSPTPIPGDLGNTVNVSEIEGVRDEAPSSTPIPENNLNMEGSNFGKTLGKSMLVLLLVIVIILIVLSPATIVDRFFRLEKISHKRIRKEMQRKGNARAIKMVNRAIYRKLCFSGMIKKGCTDREYEEALKSNFSVLWPKDWDRYMNIVKAAEFSLREFSDEEVEFCYKIYRDIIY